MQLNPKKLITCSLISVLVLITVGMLAVLVGYYGLSVGIDFGLLVVVFLALSLTKDLKA